MTPSARLGAILIGSKVSDILLSAKTTLPTLITAIGAPTWMVQLLVPIRESGALLPQMLFAYLLRRYARRDIPWFLGMLIQFVATILMLSFGLFASASVSGIVAGYGILLALALMSFARALCSLTTKDIQGKHIEKGQRGRLLGSASTVSSVLSIVVAVLALIGSKHMGTEKLLVVALVALTTQVISMWLMRPLKTQVDTERRAVKKGLYFDAALIKFVIVRALLAHTALLAPLFVLSYQGDTLDILAYLIIAQSCASFISSYAWGSLSDISALYCMRGGALVVMVATICLLIMNMFYPHLSQQAWGIIGLFFILGIGHQGVRTGRKIYGVDIAVEQHRTEFIATSNTLVGIAIMLFGAVYAGVTAYSSELSVLIMFAALSIGFAGSYFLKSEK